MYSRVLYKDGSYVPQARPMLWPVWHNISDTIFEEESEKLDCYNTDLEPEDVARDCAKRYVRNIRDFHGTVRYTKWTTWLFRKFQGPMGIPGMQGAKGDRGFTGAHGFSKGALDLQCPNPDCRRFLSDNPEQELLVDLRNGNEFDHTCNKCSRGTTWRIVHGLPIPFTMLKDVHDKAAAACRGEPK